MQQHPEAINLLFEDGQNALHVTAKCGHLKVLCQLYDGQLATLDPLATDQLGNSILHYSAMHGDWNKTLSILRAKFTADDLMRPNHKGETIAHLAADNKHLHFLHSLRKDKGDEVLKSLDNNQNSVLHHACYHGAVRLSLWLHKSVVLPFTQKNKQGDTPLHVLAKRALEDASLWRSLELNRKAS